MNRPNDPLVWSFVVAALSASSRWTVLPLTPTSFNFVYFSAALIVPWSILLVSSTRSLGRRGLCGLIGAPLVVFWPFAFVLLWWSCRHGYECM